MFWLISAAIGLAVFLTLAFFFWWLFVYVINWAADIADHEEWNEG